MWNDLLINLSVFRDHLLTVIQQNLPEPQSALLAGIVLGVKSTITPEFRQALIVTGTIHVIVVSGFNISLICGWVSNLNNLFSKRMTYVLVILCVVFYSLLTGFEPPTIRAAIMGLVGFGAKVFGRVNNGVYMLLLASVIMYLMNRTVLESVSFQLSFLATLGVILFSSDIQKYLKWVPKPFDSDLATTLAAQILVFPVLLYYFGSISLIAPLVNTLTLWTIPLATILGFLLLTVSAINLSLAQVVGWFVWVPLTIFYQVIRFSAAIPYAQVLFVKQNLIIVIGIYLVIIGLYLLFLNHVKEAK